MPTDPAQLILAAFEITLLLVGVFLLLRLAFNPVQQIRWLGTNRLPLWPVTLPEFALFAALIFLCGFSLQTGGRLLFGEVMVKTADRSGLEVLVYGAGFHGGALLGWLLFPVLRRHLHADYGSVPPPPPVVVPAPLWPKVLLHAGGTLLVALPLLSLISLGWTFLLRKIGLPDDPQQAIEIFANTKSPLVVAGMFGVACILAPLNEELLFRAGLYRFCRQTLGRNWALLISGCLFGALHANWAGFLPLALLGAGLALVYEATGSIRTAVIAHGLFNLNTILIVLSGLQ